MKKRILGFSLILLVSFFISFFRLPIKVNAVSDGFNGCRLYIGGKEVTKYNLSGDGWTFDLSTNTITLNNFALGTKGYHIRNENKGNGTYRKFAIIYVESPINSSMDLTINSVGNNTNVIGDTYHSDDFFDYVDGYATAFCGIYNPNGNVTITGSTELIIGTHLECVTSSSLTIDTNCWVYANSYTCAIDVTHMTAKGNGRISTMAYCANSSTYGYNSTIHAAQSINIYDSAVITAEMYRDEKNNNYAVNAIYSYTINARGGRITAKCYANGPKATKGNGIDCIAILVSTLNVSSGAVVEAYVYNTSRKTYVGTAAIGHVYPENANININGAGVIRTGIQMKRPSGDNSTKEEVLYSVNKINVDTHVKCTVSKKDYRPSGFENFDRYEERVASVGDGIYIRSNDGVQEWSYFRDFRKIQGSGKKTSPTPSSPIQTISGFLNNVDEILTSNSNLPVYILSGTVMLNLKENGMNIQKITVEGGTLNIRFSEGKTFNFTQQLEIKKNAKVNVDGDGIASGLNVIGEGKIQFKGGTVTGDVYKPVEMIVDGGNINVNYHNGENLTSAINSKGQKVASTLHTIQGSRDYKKISSIKMKEREYGSVGMYLLDGRTVCIWTIERSEVTSARVTYLENGEYKSVTLYKSYGITDLVESTSINANYSSLHSVRVGSNIILHPFNEKNANVSGFNLKWAYSDDGINWEEIDNSKVNEYGNLTIENVPLEYNGRQYRCEIYSKYEDDLLDTFSTELYVYSSKLESDNEFVDGEEATIRIVPDIAIPDSLYFRSNWYVSKDGGNTFNFVSSFIDKDYYSFVVEDYMDGWIVKCESVPHIGRYEFPEYQVSTFTINVIKKKVRIEEQPKGLTFANYDNSGYGELTVKARNATKYQWQVSKRKYVNNEEPFEDIPGENSPTYKFKMDSIGRDKINYFYRCVVSNEYGEVITDEVNNTVYYKPHFNSVENNMSVGQDGVASTVIHIDPGNPVIANNVIWKVSRNNGLSFETLSDEIMNGVKYDIVDIIMTSGETKVQFSTMVMLEIENPNLDMNGWIFKAILYTGEEKLAECSLNLIVLSECQIHGHDWLPATCTSLSKCSRQGCNATTGDLLAHTGGVATCTKKAECEVCGSPYGELDPNNHTGEDVWNEEDWEHSAGHESTWSCCGTLKHPYEYHKYHEGICTVCNYICDHKMIIDANCHARKHCYICQMDFGMIDPDNHDLSLGTYVKDQKDATCEEEGYTGDIMCWNCMECVTKGGVIAAKGHDNSWPATCKELAYCSVCKKNFGNLDPNNHAEWSYYIKNATTHEKHWNCCDMVTIEEHDFDENNICKVCLYGCTHSGGTANCVEKAVCEKCGDPYGELDLNNHVGALYYNYDENTHTGICACGKKFKGEVHNWGNGLCIVCNYECIHSDGEATCINEAICGKCGVKYGNLDLSNHEGILEWSKTSTTHLRKWSCCNTIIILEEEHTIVDGVCTICHYGCKHSGGEATCNTQATCSICGEKYGELLSHKDTNNDHKCDTCNKVLSECIDADHNHKCDICEKVLSEHTFSEWKVVKEATTNEEGLEERVCSECNEKETRSIAKIEKKGCKGDIVALPISLLTLAGFIILFRRKTI